MRHTDVAREEIAELLGDLFAGFESRDWDRMADLVGDKVHLDHTSLGAPAPEDLTGAEIVARWRAGPHARKKNFHLLSQPRIRVDGGLGGGVGVLGPPRHLLAAHGERLEGDGVRVHEGPHPRR